MMKINLNGDFTQVCLYLDDSDAKLTGSKLDEKITNYNELLTGECRFGRVIAPTTIDDKRGDVVLFPISHFITLEKRSKNGSIYFESGVVPNDYLLSHIERKEFLKCKLN